MPGALQPWALLLGLAALPLVALYTWRRRRVAAPIPSLLLWRDLPGVAPPRRRLFGRLDERHLALALFLTALAGLVGAGAGLGAGGPLPRDVVVVVDVSGSMATRGHEGSRLEEARPAALRLLAALGPRDQGWLVAAGAAPRLVWGPAHGRLLAAEAPRLLPLEGGRADLRGALRLADALLRLHSRAPRRPEVWVLSDGCPPRTLLAPEVALHHVAPPARQVNLALEATLRRAGSALRLEATLVHRAGDAPARRSLAVHLDGAPALLLPAEGLDPGERVTLTPLTLPAPGARPLVVEARLGGGADDHPLDDARAWVVHPRPPLRVRRDGPPARFLDAALAADGEVSLVGPDAPALEAARRCVRVVTGPAAGASTALGASGGPTLYVGPAALGPAVGLQVTAAGPYAGEVRAAAHPLLRHVALGPMLLAARPDVRVTPGSGWRAVAWAEQAPLLLVRERAGAREAALAFSPARSDLALRRGLPLLVAGAVRWLAERPPAAPTWLRVGEALAARRPGPAGAAWLLPGGATRRVPAGAEVALRGRPGVVRRALARRAAAPALALHADPAEADLAVAATPPGALAEPWPAGPGAPGAIVAGATDPRRAWALLALAALACEAAWFHRRGLP